MPNNQRPFIRIPNNILQYSFSINHLILPIYIYSAINANPYNDFIVDTNIQHIVDTYLPNHDSRCQIPSKVEQALKLLLCDTDDTEVCINSKTFIIPGFSNCLQLTSKDINLNLKIPKNMRFQYKFLDREIGQIKGWTKLYCDEYYQMLSFIDSQRQIDISGYKKWNFVELLNTFLYLRKQNEFYKSIISKSSAVSSAVSSTLSPESRSMYESNDKISQALCIGKNSVVKYKRQLQEIGVNPYSY